MSAPDAVTAALDRFAHVEAERINECTQHSDCGTCPDTTICEAHENRGKVNAARTQHAAMVAALEAEDKLADAAGKLNGAYCHRNLLPLYIAYRAARAKAGA